METVKIGEISTSEAEIFRTLAESEIIFTFEFDKEEPGEQTLDIKVHFEQDSGSGDGKVLTRVFVQGQKVVPLKRPRGNANFNRVLSLTKQEIKDLFPKEDKKVITQLAEAVLRELENRLEEEEISFI